MDNQHKRIKGFRDLSPNEINLGNVVKDLENSVGKLIEQVESAIANVDPEALRWTAIARTNIETGLMFLAKAVYRPTNGLGRRQPLHLTQHERENISQSLFSTSDDNLDNYEKSNGDDLK